jgi:hypothetical protein
VENKEQWANEVLASIEGVKRACPANNLFEKINAQLHNTVQVKIIPLRKLFWAAAAACILITVNIFELTASSNGANQNGSKDRILTDFTLYN